MRKLIYLLTVLLIVFTFTFVSASAENDENVRSIFIISNHMQDDAGIDEILNDFNCGADMVSVSVKPETVDGEEGSLSAEKFLKNLLVAMPSGKKIIIDNYQDVSDKIGDILENDDVADKIILRMYMSPSAVSKMNLKNDVICVYSGGIVFSAINVAEKSDKYVQYQSKNYFNPFYQKIVTSRFEKNSLIAIAPTYNPDLCGQRADNGATWDEMIDRGYNAFETNNLKALVEYREQLDAQKVQLADFYDETWNHIGESEEYVHKYSQNSYKNYRSALTNARAGLDELSSLSKLQNSYSALKYAQNNLVEINSTEAVKGAWNITAGKVIASILSGAGLIGFELFLKKKKGRIKLY